MGYALQADTRAKLTLGLINLLMAIRVYETHCQIDSYGIAVDHYYTDAVNNAVDAHKANFDRANRETTEAGHHVGFCHEYDAIVEYALSVTGMTVDAFKNYEFS